MLRISDCQALGLKGDIYLSWPNGSAPQQLREHCGWGDRNNIKVRRWGGVPWNTVFCTWWGHYTQELTVAMVICIRQAQDQASHHSSMVGGGAHGAPPLTEELLVIDGFCEEQYCFPLGVWLLVGCPWSCGWPHSHESISISQTALTDCIIILRKRRRGRGKMRRLLILQRARVSFSAHMLSRSQPPVVPALAGLVPSSGFCVHLHSHVYAHTQTHTHTHN